MIGNRRKREAEQEARLAEAEGAAAEVQAQDRTVKSQLNFVDRLATGWKRVHETNHLAQLFTDEGHIG